MPIHHSLPEGAPALELNIGPVIGLPYLEVAWGPVRALAMFDPERETLVDAAWASDHPDLSTGGVLAGCRIGGLDFDAVKVTVVDLGPENEGRTWPTPVVLGRQIAEQAQFYIDVDRHAWHVER